jgi:phage anti-repressor protein
MEIISIKKSVINGEEQMSVNARELWQTLESKQEFSTWIKNRLTDFEKDIDYTVHKIMNGENKGRFAAIEYTLTLDTAKHLAMLERNEIGKKIRQYFIEVEKEYRYFVQAEKEPVTVTAPNLPESTAELLHSINKRLLAGDEVDKEVLRYAWNVGKMFEKAIRRNCSVRRDDDIAEFICNLPQGEYTRAEIFEMYKQSTGKPASPRWFWEHARTARDFRERRSASTRYVIIED